MTESFNTMASAGSGSSLMDFWPILVVLLVGGVAFFLAKKYFMD
jgi:hypothetical protein